MSAIPSKYGVSFTAASLEVEELRRSAAAFVANGYTWADSVKGTERADILGKVNPKTASRKLSEFKKRIATLSYEQLDMLVAGSFEDATKIAFLACVKAYPLLRDYCSEVLARKITSFDRKATKYELDQFIDSKALVSPELAKVSEMTLAKVKQVMRRMLAQADLLVLDEPQTSHPSPAVAKLLVNESALTLQAMLIEPATIKSIKGASS